MNERRVFQEVYDRCEPHISPRLRDMALTSLAHLKGLEESRKQTLLTLIRSLRHCAYNLRCFNTVDYEMTAADLDVAVARTLGFANGMLTIALESGAITYEQNRKLVGWINSPKRIGEKK